MNRQRSAWWVVVGSVLGLIVGNGPILQFSFGVFVKPVSEALQAERGTLSAAVMVGLLATAISTPFVGRLVDRYGIRAVTLPAIALFSVSIAAIGFATTAWAYIALYALSGIAAAGQTPLSYCKAVSSAFDARRGLALGIAIAGVGLGTALVPPLAQGLITRFDWRVAYIGLGILTFGLAFTSMALLVTRRGEPEAGAGAVSSGAAQEGLGTAEALRSATFWKLAISFFLVALAAGGTVAHIVPLITDRGVTPQKAAIALTAAGIALIGGRLLSGYLLDRIFAPIVATVFFALPLVGILILLATTDASLVIPAAILVGLGLGAEVDLIAFLQTRYLGLRAFGEIYGYLFAVFMVGSAIGPFAMGMSFQVLHSYSPALWVLAAGLVISCFLMAWLGRYAYGAMPGAGAQAPRMAGQAN
jgi:MFS family permease